MNSFEKASRLKLRFGVNGQISVEQLWDSKLSNLVDYEQELTELIESYGKSTRRSRTVRTKEQELNELRLEIVTYVLDVREKEKEDAENAASVKEHNQRILELIKNKKEEQLASLSVDELQAMLK